MDSIYSDFGDISGRNISVIGTGNIGFKCSLALTECGANITCFNRTTEKAMLAVNSITTFKPFHTIASPRQVLHLPHAFNLADLSIISGSEIDLPINDIVNISHPGHIIYVLGHSIFSEGSLETLAERNIIVKRVDIGRTLASYVIGQIASIDYNKYGYSSGDLHDLCSGGFIGKKGTLIVDDHQSPQVVFGQCDGIGGSVPVPPEYAESIGLKSCHQLVLGDGNWDIS